jgi:hypothetical protein
MVCTVESRFEAARARNSSLCVFDVYPDIRCSKDSGKTYQSGARAARKRARFAERA